VSDISFFDFFKEGGLLFMEAKKIKRGPEFALFLLSGAAPLATSKATTLFEYNNNNQRTEKIRGFSTELILPSFNYEKIVTITPSMPRVFLSGDLQEAVKVELINPIAEVRYNNTLCLYADDIVLAEEGIEL
jgi:hypothetical protein